MNERKARADFPVVALMMALVMAVATFAGSLGGTASPIAGAIALANQSVQVPSLTFGGQAGDLSGAANGSIWYDTSLNAIRGKTAQNIGGLELTFTPPIADSTTLTNPTAVTQFTNSQQILANGTQPGTIIHTYAWGKYTTGAVTQTVLIGSRIGATTMANSIAFPIAVAQTNQSWELENTTIIRTTGAAGTFATMTRTSLDQASQATIPDIERAENTLNTSGAMNVEVQVQTSNQAGNTITMEGFVVSVRN